MKRVNKVESIINRKIISKIIRGQCLRWKFKQKSGLLLLGKGSKIFIKCASFQNSLVLGDYVRLYGKQGNIIFGQKNNIGDFSIIKANFNEKSFIKFGTDFSCGEFCYFGSAGGILIGNSVMFAQNVRIHAQSHLYSKVDETIRSQGTTETGVIIGNDCWIGSGVVVLDGVTIGDGCVIGSNSVVTKNIPSYSVAVGSPAKVIKNRDHAK